jgi:ribosomal protein S18 acetylase RimI-like enzyme
VKHSAVALRAYAAGDRAACLHVFESNVPTFFRHEERPGFESFLDALPGPYFVLLDDGGAVVGCGGYALGAASGIADLCWGMVLRGRQGEGLGRALTEMRIEQASLDSRVHAVRLETSQHTVGFYQHLGFHTTNREPDGYAPGLDRVTMEMQVGRGPPAGSYGSEQSRM